MAAMQNPSPQVKCAMCTAVRAAGMGGSSYQQEITNLLGDQDSDVEYQACLAIAAMGQHAANSKASIIPLLENGQENVRYGACTALGYIKAADCIDKIVGMLSDNSPEVQ